MGKGLNFSKVEQPVPNGVQAIGRKRIKIRTKAKGEVFPA
jgi:hypothetical protein